MRFAYADPPYLGLAEKYYGHLHPEEYDKPETHKALIDRMCAEFDGWALSLHLPTLKTMLEMCPDDVRVGAWVKPFASFKKNVTRAWTWEPIILWGGRPIPITQNTVQPLTHVSDGYPADAQLSFNPAMVHPDDPCQGKGFVL